MTGAKSLVGGGAPASLRYRRALWLSLAAVLLYWANGRALVQVDCIPAPYAAWSLASTGSVDLREVAYLDDFVGGIVRELPSGARLSIVPPGSTLSALPFALPLTWLHPETPSSGKMRRFGKAVAAFYVAAAVGLFYLLAMRLVPETPRAALAATLLFGAGTGLYSVASQALWMHGPATFFLVLAFFLATRSAALSPRAALVVGLSLGLAVVTRPTTVFFVVASLAALASLRQLRSAVALASTAAVPILGFLLYNQHSFGHAIIGGYGEVPWPTPMGVGLLALLVAPSRGLLVYSPALAAVPIGFWALWSGRRCVAPTRRSWLLAWSAASLLTLLLYARSGLGGWTFGPRYLIETLPVLCLLFALAYEKASSKAWPRRGLQALLAVSIAVQLVGVFGDPRGSWHLRHSDRASLFDLQDSQIEAHLRHLLRGGRDR